MGIWQAHPFSLHNSGSSSRGGFFFLLRPLPRSTNFPGKEKGACHRTPLCRLNNNPMNINKHVDQVVGLVGSAAQPPRSANRTGTNMQVRQLASHP